MQAFTCYNEATKNALAVLSTPESVAELVTGLKENKSDMPKPSTPIPLSQIRDYLLRLFVKHYLETPGCWPWTGALDKDGYREWSVARNYGLTRSAHRASWILHNGEIADDRKVLHRCDTPRCVKPAHLFLGTNKDNTQDMLKKRRHYHGEQHWKSSINADTARAMRAMYADVKDAAVVARHFGTSYTIAWNTVTRRSWKEVE